MCTIQPIVGLVYCSFAQSFVVFAGDISVSASSTVNNDDHVDPAIGVTSLTRNLCQNCIHW